jgi:glutathione S-transferase
MDQNKIKYSIVEVDRNNKPDEVNATGGTVPVIDHDGEIVSDSSLIIEYLMQKVIGNK